MEQELKEYINQFKELESLSLVIDTDKDMINYNLKFKIKGDNRNAFCRVSTSKVLKNYNENDIVLHEFKRDLKQFLS